MVTLIGMTLGRMTQYGDTVQLYSQ